MRPGLLAVMLAASGLVGCTASMPTPLPEAKPPASGSIVGEWTSVDTLSQTFEPPPGSDVDSVTFQTVQAHLSIGGTAWTETSVYWNTHGYRGESLEATGIVTSYRVEGDSVFVRYDPTFPEAAGVASVRRDTLTVTFDLPRGERSAQRFVRSEPLGVPPDLVGVWVGDSPPDPAGVPARIAIRFTEAGTVEGEGLDAPQPVVALGGYLVVGDRSPTSGGEEGVTFYNPFPFPPAIPFEVDGDRLVLGIKGQSLVLYRRPE